MTRVLQIGASRKTMGGVTSVLKAWETAEFWRKYQCKWIETQDNRGLLYKLYYFFRSLFLALLWVPKFDIIHFHTTPGRSILVQLPIFLLSIISRKKIIVQLHVGNQLEDHLEDKLFNWTLKKADRIVVLAFVWLDLLVDRYCIDSSKVSVIYNPAPEVTPSNSKEKYVLYLAYLVENKGYDIVIKAFSKVSLLHNDWHLIMAGKGELDRVRKLVQESNAGEKIEILDWITGKKKEELWQHAGAYCMASYQEGFPMTVLEAWSYGTPLVTTPVGGLPDVIKDGENALVFGFGDIDGLAEKFNLLFSSEELRFKLSNASLELAKNKFSLESIDKALDSFYSSVLS